MKHTLLFTLTLIVSINCNTVAAQQQDTVFVSNFGAHVYSYTNSVTNIQAAINECKRTGAHVLSFEKGRYDIWPEGAIRKEYFITNTSTEQECPSKVKTIGLLFEDMKDLVIDGKGATLMFHGKMTTIALEHCKNLTFQNLQVDFERPAGSEITFTQVDGNEVEVKVHRDTRYEIVNDRMTLYGEGWRSNRNHCIEYDPADETFRYSQGWNVLSASKAKEIAPNVIHFNVQKEYSPKVGNTLTIRDIIRDQVGWFIFESSDITLSQIQMHYMHGLGIVSQYTRNITMDRVKCMPREGSDRLLAASADMMHYSGCSGKIRIDSCYFAGAQDDPINVHGTNLRVVEKLDGHTVKLRFMHGQSYGYNAYFEGDTVAFVRASTMERFASACVVSVKRLTDRTVEVAFDRDIPKELELNHDCVENISCTPEVEIRNCYFTRTSTRGTLMTTPRKVIIANNTYYKTGMSAILIEGDAEGWYESGPVKDVLIQNNIFIDCAYNGGPEYAVIALNPSNTIIDAAHPVHRNVRIIGNTFQTFGNPVLYAKSTEGLVFKDNKVTSTLSPGDALQKPVFILNGSKNVTIKDNILKGTFRENIVFRNMKKGFIKTDL